MLKIKAKNHKKAKIKAKKAKNVRLTLGEIDFRGQK